MAEAFVYCWTDHKTNKLYIGSHKGDPDDGYICSSKYMMEQYENRPSDFTRQIIATGTLSDVRSLESAILKAENAARNPLYYNQHNADEKFYNAGYRLSKEHREKLSDMFAGREVSETWKKNISNGLKGHKVSEETRQKISVSVSASISGENNPMFGKKQSDSTKVLLSERAKNRRKVECIHCGKILDASNHGKYHGSNCKKVR